MNNRTFVALIMCVLVGMGFLLFFNLRPILYTNLASERLLPGEIRGMAVEHEGKLYTLNFSQQNSLLNYLNQAQLTQESAAGKEPWPGVSRVVVYQFNKPDLEIQPLKDSKGNLSFTAPAWDPKGLFLDASNGAMGKLLEQSYKENV